MFFQYNTQKCIDIFVKVWYYMYRTTKAISTTQINQTITIFYEVNKMHEITENTSLEMTDVLTFRGKVTQQRLNDVAKEMADIIRINGAKKTMSGVSATFAVENSGGEIIMDIELMYPLDRDIYVPAPYTIKPVFRLKNAVKIRHMGNPATMQDTANELMQYIKFKKLTPITSGYILTIQEPSGPDDTDSLIADIYIGVSDNIL